MPDKIRVILSDYSAIVQLTLMCAAFMATIAVLVGLACSILFVWGLL